tara:strand:- start:454 stop:558 length:105 start_codon:yes stop_codon:yes gene_type:complete
MLLVVESPDKKEALKFLEEADHILNEIYLMHDKY